VRVLLVFVRYSANAGSTREQDHCNGKKVNFLFDEVVMTAEYCWEEAEYLLEVLPAIQERAA
jgi:hypothetical protein